MKDYIKLIILIACYAYLYFSLLFKEQISDVSPIYLGTIAGFCFGYIIRYYERKN